MINNKKVDQPIFYIENLDHFWTKKNWTNFRPKKIWTIFGPILDQFWTRPIWTTHISSYSFRGRGVNIKLNNFPFLYIIQ